MEAFNKLGLVILHTSAQGVLAMVSGILSDTYFPQSDDSPYTPTSALLDLMEVSAQIFVSATLATFLFMKLTKLSPQYSDPQFGLTFSTVLTLAQPNLQTKLHKLVGYAKKMLSPAMPGTALGDVGQGSLLSRPAPRYNQSVARLSGIANLGI